MSGYNQNAQIYDSQFVIRDSSTSTSSTSGGLIVEGGIAARDTYVRGDIVANEVKITPNLGDISKEVRVSLVSSGNTYAAVDSNFRFYNDKTLAFQAMMFANTVADGGVKNAVWHMNGVLNGDAWSYNTNFTGDLIPSFDLRLANVTTGNAHAQVEYTSPTATVLTYRAKTSSKVDPITQVATSLLAPAGGGVTVATGNFSFYPNYSVWATLGTFPNESGISIDLLPAGLTSYFSQDFIKNSAGQDLYHLIYTDTVQRSVTITTSGFSANTINLIRIEYGTSSFTTIEDVNVNTTKTFSIVQNTIIKITIRIIDEPTYGTITISLN